MWKAAPHEHGKTQTDATGNSKQPHIVQARHFQKQPQHRINDQRRDGTNRDQSPKHLWCFVLSKPLQRQRLLERFEIVKTDGHQDGGEIQPVDAGEHTGDCHPDTKQRKRQHRKGLLFQNQQHKYGGESEETRYFTYALQDANLNTGKRRTFHNEVVQQGRPRAEGNRHGDGHQHEQRDGVTPGGGIGRGWLD